MKTWCFGILICVLTLTACKKGKANFVVRGTITDNTFSQSLSGATIKLYETPIGTSELNLIGTTSTDSDGTYSFEFQRNKVDKYTLVLTKTLYFDINSTINFSELTVSEDNIRNYSTTAKSWVKLHFVNASPYSVSDHLKFIKQNGKVSCPECCSSDEHHLYGIVDTSIYCINDGNTEYSYLYWVINTSNSGFRSVTTVAFDTTELLLTY